ncbi:MAG: hypothetical protein ACR2H3_03610 [Acidimicrobiales bacterium]
MASARLETILDADYLAGIEDLPMDDVRARRTECQAVEVALSYARRLVQGRLDIIGAELERRSRGEGPTTASELVELLQHGDLFGGHSRPEGFGRLPTLLAPDDADTEEIRREAAEVARSADLSRLPDLDDAAVTGFADRLAAYESTTSAQRRAVFEVIDTLQAEIVRRYKSGAATVDTLLK